MEDLREEVRDAFEKEQAKFPPAMGLRHNVVRAAAVRPRQEPNLQWIAAVAALLIAALVIAALVSSRVGLRQPTPAATPSTRADYGPPPAGVPLFYLAVPDHAGWYTGFDWTGEPRGTIKLAQPLDEFSNLAQSPDGAGFWVDAHGKPPSTVHTLDRLGQSQSPFPYPAGLYELIWADDNRHLCSLAVQNGNIVLSWHVPTYTANVAIVGKPNGPTDRGYGLRGCSFATDQRAVIERDVDVGIPAPKEYLVVGLGDGRVIARKTIGPGVANSIVVSHDGTFVALNSLKADGFPEPTAAHTVVADLSRNTTIDLDPSLSVLAFSGDDRVVLVTTGWYAGQPTNLQAIELATGKVLWSYDGGAELSSYFVEPDAEDFALLMKPAGDQDLHPKVTILIERPDGTSTTVQGSFTQP